MLMSIDVAVISPPRSSSAFRHCELAWLDPMPRSHFGPVAIFEGRLEGRRSGNDEVRTNGSPVPGLRYSNSHQAS